MKYTISEKKEIHILMNIHHCKNTCFCVWVKIKKKKKEKKKGAKITMTTQTQSTPTQKAVTSLQATVQLYLQPFI